MIKIVTESFSILQHAYLSFWSVLMTNSFTHPNYTDLIRLTEAMLLAESEPNEVLIQEVADIYENTNDEINYPLGKIEFIVFYQLNVHQASLNKEIEIDGKNWKILDLYGFLDKTNQKLVKIVISIAKSYNLDIPLSTSNTAKLQF